ncbi:CvfB family protein [Enterococcus nangangensis]|uniref:CvfB family protein n=1 Tax=Enterococcus nangangensis TaxID=2559926 RepID=UPI0010F557FB|nr:S1-like domain-containing RNA-binding protein [Enterococcus nangangensis]
MEELLGRVATGLITDENQDYYYVQKNGVTFQLAKAEGAHQLGESVEGFFYVNQQQHNAFTTVIPKIVVGRYGFGEVKSVRRDLGVFVDIGLPDKEVVVSLDSLSEIKELWPKPGDRLYITLRVDHKNRIWGELATENIILSLFKRLPQDGTWQNKEVTGTVYRLKLAGTFVLTDDFYQAFIHPSERYREPRLGERVTGRVIGVSSHGYLNLSLKPRSYEVIDNDALMLLTFLERAQDHKIPFTDKSDPEAIKDQFGISKGQFKRAIGHLLKAKKIKQEEGYTILLEK